MESRHGSQGSTSTFLIGVLLGALIVGILAKIRPFSGEEDLDHYKEVRDFVRERYVEEPDPDELVRIALAAMVESLDEYSRYLSTTAETSTFDRETRGSFTGIGVVFKGPVEGGRVLFPMSRSPAAKAGVRVGDLILSVDGIPLEGKTEAEARGLFKGEVGSIATLKLAGLSGLSFEKLCFAAHLPARATYAEDHLVLRPGFFKAFFKSSITIGN